MKLIFRARLMLSVCGFLIFSSHAESACTQLITQGQYQALKNTCAYEIVLVYCGTGPSGNSSFDCSRRKFGMTGVSAGGVMSIEDSYGSYESVHWLECSNGRSPSNTRWENGQIKGYCPN